MVYVNAFITYYLLVANCVLKSVKNEKWWISVQLGLKQVFSRALKQSLGQSIKYGRAEMWQDMYLVALEVAFAWRGMVLDVE